LGIDGAGERLCIAITDGVCYGECSLEIAGDSRYSVEHAIITGIY